MAAMAVTGMASAAGPAQQHMAVSVVPAAQADPVGVAAISGQSASPEAGPRATVNLDLSTQQAKNVQ